MLSNIWNKLISWKNGIKCIEFEDVILDWEIGIVKINDYILTFYRPNN